MNFNMLSISLLQVFAIDASDLIYYNPKTYLLPLVVVLYCCA
jgi:hypothetical protein